MRGRTFRKLERTPGFRWAVALVATAAIAYQMWAVSVDAPRFVLFDRETLVPSWLVLTLTHVAGVASAYALQGLLRRRDPNDQSKMALGFCLIAMFRFANDSILDRLAKRNGATYPAQFGIGCLFLILGIAYQKGVFRQSAPSPQIPSEDYATQ